MADLATKRNTLGPANLSREDVLAGIEGSGGILTNVARALHVSRQCAKQHIYKWQQTRAAFESEAERIVDLAQHNVHSEIEEGDSATSKWYLTHYRRGLARGFADRQVHSGDDGAPIEFTLALGDGAADDSSDDA